MTRLELNQNESKMLRDVLESYLGDLRSEISITDSHDLREELRAEESFLRDLIQRLPG